MNRRNFVVTTLFLVVALANAFPQSELRGCTSPNEIAEKLARLQASDWKTVSADKVQAIWLMPFDEVVCNNPKACRFLVTKQRVINGHCECCEAFKFELRRGAENIQTEDLTDAIFHYTSANRTKVLRAARLLGQAAGMSRADVATIGNDFARTYRLRDSRHKTGDSYVLEIRLTQIQSNWELYFNLGLESP